MGEDEDREFEPESEGSLEQFEEELLKEEKKKARSKSLMTVLIVLFVLSGGFYAYINFFAPKEEPLPPVISAALSKKERPAVKSGAERQQKEDDQWVADKEEKTPAKDAAVEKTTETEQPASAAETAKEEALKEKGVQTKLPEMASPEMASMKPQPKKEPEKAEETKKASKPQPEPQVVAKAEPPVEKTEEKAIEKKVEPAVTTPSSVVTDARTYILQAGFFAVPKNAEIMMGRLEKLGLTPTPKKTAYSSRRVAVWEGYYKFRELAQDMAELLSGQGFKPKVVLTGPGNYSLKIGEYGSEAAADATVKSLEERGFSVRLETARSARKATIVRIENIRGKQRLDEIRAVLKENNIDNFVVRR